ncbi:MAG: diphosphomevalonate decarboxylase [Proteobacteria bacterium]|nr:MAG: diphosphomevalonate decarboxylase [Pseudomonadota bacterium]
MTEIYRVSSPSNIAFLKYWGKKDPLLQWPASDSLSMSLNTLATKTTAYIHDAADHLFQFQGESLTRDHKSFHKVFKHLDYLSQTHGFTEKLAFSSSNSFPTGAGVASSASGLSALTLSAIACWTHSASFDELEKNGFSREHIAHLSRIGSGSAGRSLFGGYVHWQAGTHADKQKIIPLYSASHWNLHDTVALFSHDEKSKSSTAAHSDAWSSPLFSPRIAGAPERLQAMLKALYHRDMASLGPLLETEALDMHAVMMTTRPPQHYLTTESTEFLAAFRRARQDGVFEAYFTIDAGPNIHIIHEASQTPALHNWLKEFYPNLSLLSDKVGEGPSLERGMI